MFAALRRPFNRLIVLVCLAGILLPAASRSHVLWDDDPACASTAPLPDGQPRHIESGRDPANPPHCVVCHALRLLAGAEPVETASTLLGLAPRELAILRLPWWYDEAFSADRPSRAPPVSSLLA